MEDKAYKEIMEQLTKQKVQLPQDDAKAKMAVLMGIDKAMEEKAARKKHQLFALRLSFTCLTVFCVGIIGLNTNVGWYQAFASVPVIGTFADVFTFNRYQQEQGNASMDISVAKVDEYQRSVGVNEQIDDYAQSLVDQYNAIIEDTNGESHYALESDYSIKYEDDKYLCIEVYTTELMAGSNQFVKTFTVDKETGEPISLAQFLQQDVELMSKVGANIVDQMQHQMANDENISYWIDESPLGDYTFSTINGSENYYLINEHTIVIQFDKYEVAPGYMGIVEFTVDLSAL